MITVRCSTCLASAWRRSKGSRSDLAKAICIEEVVGLDWSGPSENLKEPECCVANYSPRH